MEKNIKIENENETLENAQKLEVLNFLKSVNFELDILRCGIFNTINVCSIEKNWKMPETDLLSGFSKEIKLLRKRLDDVIVSLNLKSIGGDKNENVKKKS